MPTDLVLLDLDETLLPTELLVDARHSDWPVDLATIEGYARVGLHDGISDALIALATLTRVGLVTSSPRWYVDQILAAQLPAFAFAVQVTYDDVENIKPHPEPLRVALDRVGVAVERAVYVGDADVDFEACAAAGLDFIGAGWADLPTFPASAPRARTPHALVELIGGRA